jgi:hypothetical protein
MGTHVRSRVVLSLSAALLILSSATAFAASENRHETIGHMTANAAGVSWQVGADNDSVSVTITGPNDFLYTHEFPNTHAVNLKMKDFGANPADGQYTYEMRLTPRISASVKAQLAAARKANDDAAAAQIMAAAGLNNPLVQSGTITIVNGSFVSSDMTEPGQSKSSSKSALSSRTDVGTSDGTASVQFHNAPVKALDVVTADDEIIQGSLCVGFDCVVNESFGFDTIRLKENNDRIKFEDTSTGSCPSNDWQLTANDSCPGGNKFSIEDITGAKVPFTITAGAATNSFFLDSTGRLGLKTATPVLDIHVATSNTPAIRLEQNSSGGFTAQTWDVAGNEANFFVRDVTGGSRLPFRIRPGAPTSSIDISASGDVGIGTASPSENMHVLSSDDANNGIQMENSNSSGLSANAFVRTKADTATVSFQSHGSARTISRFGRTLGGQNEMLATSGALILGTLGTADLVLGTNSANRMTINGSTGAVTVPGNFTVTGTKNFAVVDPANAKNALYYTALEGPEAGTYFRGTAKTVNGEVVIELPGYFARLTETERMTVQLTPVGAPGQLYVAAKSPEKLTIKVAKGDDDIEFDYLVQGVRKGYLNYEVERAGAFPVQQ